MVSLSMIIICSPGAGCLDAGEEDGGLQVQGELDVGQVGQAQQRVDDVAVLLGLLHVSHGKDNLGIVCLDYNYVI